MSDTQAQATPKKSKKLMFIALGALLVLGLGGGGAVYAMKQAAAKAEAAYEEEADAETSPKKPKKMTAEQRAALEAKRVWVQYPSITANLAAGSGVLQATVDIQLAEESVKARLEKARPLVLAKILDLFASVGYEQIVDPKVKAALADSIKAEVNIILSGEESAPDVNLVVFSTFISMAN